MRGSDIVQRILACDKVPQFAQAPVANFKLFTRASDQIFMAGQIGQAGLATLIDLNSRDGQASARQDGELAALRLLAAITAALEQYKVRLSAIHRCAVYIAAPQGFTAHAQLADAVSDTLVSVLGDLGRHARTSIGVASLPAGALFEVDAVIGIEALHDA